MTLKQKCKSNNFAKTALWLKRFGACRELTSAADALDLPAKLLKREVETVEFLPNVGWFKDVEVIKFVKG